MAQLKMIRYSAEFTKRELPEGYTVKFFDGSDRMKEDWLRICSDGLLGEIPENQIPQRRGVFDEWIKNRAHAVPESDTFFILSPEGKAVATTTAIEEPEKIGYVHMVGSLPETRGKGIGHAMVSITNGIMEERGCVYSYLTTDDWRLAAIKTYLDGGFLPVLYGDRDEMLNRWNDVLLKLGYPPVEMITEN